MVSDSMISENIAYPDGGMDLSHRKEMLSNAYIYALAAAGGYTISDPKPDLDSVDFTLSKSTENDPDAEWGSIKLDLQLKSTSIKQDDPENIIIDLPIKNYNDLRKKVWDPRLLVVMCLPSEPCDWITQVDHQYLAMHKCSYYISLKGELPVENRKNKRIKIPRENIFCLDTLNEIMCKIGRSRQI